MRAAELKEELSGECYNRCLWCGRDLWPTDVTVEHLCPKSKGGRGVRISGNLTLACSVCNNERKSKSAVSYARQKEQEGLQPNWELLQDLLTRLEELGNRREKYYASKQLKHLDNL